MHRTPEQEMQQQRLAENMEKIKHKIVVMSGKGGVGKSTMSANIAYGLALEGKKVGVLDADIHGPNIPIMFGVEGEKMEHLGEPYRVHENLVLVSLSFLMGSSDQPIVWRGPAKTGAIIQLLADVNWGELDYLIVDLPPGTGDEQLTIAQNLGAIDGTVIVTTPQDVAMLDSRKSVKFAQMVNMPVLGFVENMSGFICPHCGGKIDIFKKGGADKASQEFGVPVLGKIPLEPAIVDAGDSGKPFIYFNNGGKAVDEFRGIVEKILNRVEGGETIMETGKKRIAFPTNDRTHVEEHFGHCREFAIYNIVNNKIAGVEYVTPPPHAPGVIPNFLNAQGIDTIITGGMGQRAIDMFKAKNVEVILGAAGKVDANLNEYLNGLLESTGSSCSHHHDHGEGHNCNH